MNDDKRTEGQSGGVNISGGNVTVGGDVVGRDKIVGTEISQAQLDQIFHPVMDAIRTAPPEKRSEAVQQLEALKAETAKGKKADDSVVAKLVDGLVKLVPAAVSGVVSAFATPVLGAIAGPVTKFAIDKIQGK
jgi:hypothetical protein